MKNVLRFTLAALALLGVSFTNADAQGVRWGEKVKWITSAAATAQNGGVLDSTSLCVAGAAGTMVFDTTVAVSLEGLALPASNSAADSIHQFTLVLCPANPNRAGGMATAIDTINVYAQFSANGVTWWDGTGGKSFVAAIGAAGNSLRSFNTNVNTAIAGNSPMSAFAGAKYVRFVVALDFNGCIEGWVIKNLGAQIAVQKNLL